MRWYKTSLGKKYLMAVTGLLMVLFVIAHMLGNLSIFGGANGINAYAEHLRAFPPLLWIFRVVMLCALVLHVWTGLSLYLENKAARPVNYAQKESLKTTFSARNMIWTGLLLLAFIIFHLLQFTFQLPGLVQQGAKANLVALHGAMVPNVFDMVVSALQNFPMALLYVVAMIILLLHLRHGIQSFFQSLGWTNDKTFPVIGTGGRWVAGLVVLGFVFIPVLIFFGVVKL